MPSSSAAAYVCAVGDVAVDAKRVEAEVDGRLDVVAHRVGWASAKSLLVGSRLAPFRNSRSPLTEQTQSSQLTCRSPVRRCRRSLSSLVDEHLDRHHRQWLVAERSAATTTPGR